MCQKCHKCFITVLQKTTDANINLPSNNRLEKGVITSIMLRKSGANTLKAYDGTTVASDAVINTAHLRVKNQNGMELTAPIPLSTLQRDVNNPEPLCVRWENIDPAQCSINMDGSIINSAHSIEIVFGLDCESC